MKNKLPILILVPMIAVMIVVFGAMYVRMSNSASVEELSSQTVSEKPKQFPDSVTTGSVNKPSTFMGSLFGQNGSTPTPSPATASDLSRELKDTYDDGGQSDINALQKDIDGL